MTYNFYQRLLKYVVILLLVSVAAPLRAETTLPRLELGMALSALTAPDYRGSAERSSGVIPIPYIKYRGEKFRIDEGVQGLLVNTPAWQVSLSGNFTLAVDEDNPERQGMDKLAPTLEIGPSVNYRFHSTQTGAWWLDLPLRFSFTLNRDFDHVGQVFSPRLSWRKPARRLGQWKLRFSIGPVFASQGHHDYFYSVAPHEATAARPAFDAPGGYSGLRSELTLSRRLGRYWFGSFFRYDNMTDSEIEDSPLVSDTEAWVAGIGLGYVLFEE